MPRFLPLVILVALIPSGVVGADDPLPSWNEGPTKTAIIAFVEKVTKDGSPDFVPVADRIATFDNDGTLWAEQPIYTQGAFVLDRVRALAPKHPEWKETEPFKSVLAGDMKGVIAGGTPAAMALVAATHAGMSTEEFEAIVNAWIATAKHPRFHRLYTDLTYVPMTELLGYLKANGFKTYIVSGGGIEFMRPWAGRVYGLTPEQVIGSSIKLKYEMIEGTPRLLRLPEIDFIDDKAGKPLAIQKFIGKRPIAAFGNSDGDFEMLEWTTSGKGPRLGLIVHHTDADREWSYDRDSPVGRLARALVEAPKRGWLVADMKRDWKVVFPSRID